MSLLLLHFFVLLVIILSLSPPLPLSSRNLQLVQKHCISEQLNVSFGLCSKITHFYLILLLFAVLLQHPTPHKTKLLIKTHSVLL